MCTVLGKALKLSVDRNLNLIEIKCNIVSSTEPSILESLYMPD